MPAPHPPEFRRRAIELARQPDASVAKVARELGVSESGLRRWMAQNDIDAGRREGLSTKEREDLARLRRDNRRLEMEILKRASGYFARENVLPKWGPAGRRACRRRVRRRGGLPDPEGVAVWLLRVARPATVAARHAGGVPGQHDRGHPRQVTLLLRGAPGAR